MSFPFLKALLFSAVLLCPTLASPAVRLGGIYVGGGYTHFGGGWNPYYDPYWYGAGGFYDPWLYPAMYGPGSFAYQPFKGEVKLRSSVKTASVYLNGGFAGEAGKLKQFWLDPGVYELEVRDGSQQPFSTKIYVLSGKTLTIDSKAAVEGRHP